MKDLLILIGQAGIGVVGFFAVCWLFYIASVGMGAM